ncbi:Phosphoglucosamine mutase [subsurface metagenome]|nr:phosphoglucosamine mutase [Clostridia bacterium]
MEKLFGTDGIRGIAGKYPLSPEFVEKIGIASAETLTHHFLPSGLTSQKVPSLNPTIIIGRDTRESGEMIFDGLAKGLIRRGVDVCDCGVITTPAISYLTQATNSLAGIVISASHNPYQYNGIKFFSNSGMKLPDELESEIEKKLKASKLSNTEKEKKGSIIPFQEAKEKYIEFIKKSIPQGVNFSGLKMVIDCANGSVSEIAPQIFRGLDGEVIVMNNTPDGKNINEGSGSLHLEVIQKAVKANRADLGFAFDGDGDRVLFTDEKGSDLDGDHLMALCAGCLKRKGKLKNNTLVVTSMSNLGLLLAMEKIGIRVLQTKVGDRYVLEEMLRSGTILGGEQAGHIIFLDYGKTGDGLITALRVLSIIREEKKPLSELAGIMERAPQVLINVEVKERKPFTSLPLTSRLIREAESTLGREGRILVRYSGTEPLARVMVEGKDREKIENIAKNISQAIKKELNP